MTDIFDTKIMCKKCNVEMKPRIVNRNGFELRAVECSKCGDKIIHPADLNASDQFKDLKGKQFNVKLRVVGNSHAISIPKEIVDFMEEFNKMHNMMNRDMDNMVKMCFEDFGKLRVDLFDNDSANENEIGEENEEEKQADIDRMRIRRRGK
jgi:hypothetical protein